jgi:hypothetical protein
VRRAALYILTLRQRRALQVVTHHRPPDHANHGGQGLATTRTDGVAHGTPGDSPDKGASTRFGLLHGHLLDRANLMRNSQLPNDGRRRNHSPYILSQARTACDKRHGQQKYIFHDGTTCELSAIVNLPVFTAKLAEIQWFNGKDGKIV